MVLPQRLVWFDVWFDVWFGLVWFDVWFGFGLVWFDVWFWFALVGWSRVWFDGAAAKSFGNQTNRQRRSLQEGLFLVDRTGRVPRAEGLGISLEPRVPSSGEVSRRFFFFKKKKKKC